MHRPQTSSRILLVADRRTPPAGGHGPVRRYRLARVRTGAGAAGSEQRAAGAKRIV